MNILPVHDVVLLLPPKVNTEAIRLSRQLAAHSTEFTLEEKNLYPHISLYMTNLNSEDIEKVSTLLNKLGKEIPAQPLKATHFQQNNQGMFEVFFEKTKAMTNLQERIINLVSPFRIGLREKDPVGRNLAEYIYDAPEEARANLERYGYDEIGAFFKPHITFARFKPGDSLPDMGILPAHSLFSGIYSALALCEMGEHGTCTKVVAQFKLGGSAKR